MMILCVVTWDDILANKQAWNVLVWFGTLVALASGLAQVGFVKWLAQSIGAHMTGYSPLMAMVVLTLVFFFIHYMFASITAHVTAVLPMMLAVGPVYYGSGYIPSADYWRMGAIFGAIYIGAYLLINVPWLSAIY
jgi:L-tartrate/succinate antiporter